MRFPELTTATILLLNGWTGYRTIGAEHTAIALFGSQYFLTIFTIVKELASRRWHQFFLTMSAIGTDDGRC